MENNEHATYDTIIIGGGVAGLAAAMYAGRLELKTLLIGEIMGGTIILTDIVENYPGFIRLTGQELAEKIKEHALAYPIEIVEENVTGIEKCPDACFDVRTKTRGYHAKSVIFATGAKHRKLGVPGEKEFAGRGVHTCALCDGPFYKDNIVAVVAETNIDGIFACGDVADTKFKQAITGVGEAVLAAYSAYTYVLGFE